MNALGGSTKPPEDPSPRRRCAPSWSEPPVEMSLSTAGLLLLGLFGTAAPRSTAPPSALAWAPVAGRGDTCSIAPLPDDADCVACDVVAVRATIDAGAGQAGIRSEGDWLGDILNSPRVVGLSVLLRLLTPDDADLTIAAPGRERLSIPVMPRGGAWQWISFPARGARGRVTTLPLEPLVMAARGSLQLDVAAVRPLTECPFGGYAEWELALALCTEAGRLQDELNVYAREGIQPLGVGERLRRARAAVGQGRGRQELVAAAADARDALALCRQTWTLGMWLALLGPRADLATQCGAHVDARRDLLAPIEVAIMRIRRLLAIGDRRRARAALAVVERHLRAAAWALADGLEGARVQWTPRLRAGRLEHPTGEAFVPFLHPFVADPSVDVNQVADEALRQGRNGVLLSASYSAIESGRGREPLMSWMNSLGRECDDRGMALVLRLCAPLPERLTAGSVDRPTPILDAKPWWSDATALAESMAGLARAIRDLPGLLGIALDLGRDEQGVARCSLADSQPVLSESEYADVATVFADAIESSAPGKLLFGPPVGASVSNPAYPAGLAGVAVPWSQPCVLGLEQDEIAARASVAALGPGARSSGVRLLDQGRIGLHVPPQLAAFVRRCARPRAARVAVVASAVELGAGRSSSPAAIALLEQLGVDADLVTDSAVQADPRIAARYKALVCELGSIAPAAFAALWRSGVPTLYYGDLPDHAARRCLTDNSAFVAGEGGYWYPGEPPLACLAAPAGDTLAWPTDSATALWRLAERSLEWLDAPGSGIRWRTLTVDWPARLAARGSTLTVPAGLPRGSVVAANGEVVCELDHRLPAHAGGAPEIHVPIRPGLLKPGPVNRIEIGVVTGARMDEGVLAGVTVSDDRVRRLKTPSGFAHFAPGEECEYRVAPQHVRLASADLAVGAGAVAVDTGSPGGSEWPVLVRHGNNLLWVASRTLSAWDPVHLKLVASFLAMLGEAHAYHPPAQVAMCETEEHPFGVLVAHLAKGRLELSVGTPRVLLAVAGADPAWQRIQEDGRSVLPLPAVDAGACHAFATTELELAPHGGTVTVSRVCRDTSRPERLLLQFTTSGAASTAIVNSPYNDLCLATALVDASPVRAVQRGQQVRFSLPPGEHRVRFEMLSPGLLERLRN